MGDQSPLHAQARFATSTTIFPKFTAYNISDNPWTSKPSPYNSHELETFKMDKDKGPVFQKKFLQYSSHRIFGFMNRVLNTVEKNN